MRVFARLGPDTPTIDDFIAEAGYARGTFYNYFNTREELLVAVATVVSEQMHTEMAALRRLQDPADRLGCAVRMFIRKAETDPTWGWIIVKIALIAAPIGSTMRENITADIDDGLGTGRFRTSSRQAIFDLVLGSGLMGMRSALLGEAGVGHAENVAEIVLMALGVPDAGEVAHRSMDERMIISRARPKRSGLSGQPSPRKTSRKTARLSIKQS
jgi:AcrR family transcriptional regulator